METSNPGGIARVIRPIMVTDISKALVMIQNKNKKTHTRIVEDMREKLKQSTQRDDRPQQITNWLPNK